MRRAKKARVGGILLPTLALAAVLALAGCGEGSDSSGTTPAGATASAGESESATGKPDANREAGAASVRAGSGKSAGAGSEDGRQSSGSMQSSKVPQSPGEREPGITPEQRRKATTASVTLASPSFAGGAQLPVRYTCDGKNESPPLQWAGLPSEAAELVLFALNMNPVNEALFFDWAVAGLDPSLDSIEAGELPAGAVEGKNSFGNRGYSLCPPGKSENYIFLLYAIPKALDPKPGFDPLPLREEVVRQSGNVGLLSAIYTR